MKQQNIKIINCLVILLILSALIILEVVMSAVLMVRADLLFRRDAPNLQHRGKCFVKSVLTLNAIAAACLLLLNLIFISIDLLALRPWGVVSISAALMSIVLLIPGIFAFRKLQLPPAADSDGIPEARKRWHKPR